MGATGVEGGVGPARTLDRGPNQDTWVHRSCGARKMLVTRCTHAGRISPFCMTVVHVSNVAAVHVRSRVGFTPKLIRS